MATLILLRRGDKNFASFFVLFSSRCKKTELRNGLILKAINNEKIRADGTKKGIGPIYGPIIPVTKAIG